MSKIEIDNSVIQKVQKVGGSLQIKMNGNEVRTRIVTSIDFNKPKVWEVTQAPNGDYYPSDGEYAIHRFKHIRGTDTGFDKQTAKKIAEALNE